MRYERPQGEYSFRAFSKLCFFWESLLFLFISVFLSPLILFCSDVFSIDYFISIFVQSVSYEEGEALAKDYNIHFFETSAKQDLNVEKAFLTIATDVKDRLIVDGGSGGATAGAHRVTATNANATAKKGCC